MHSPPLERVRNLASLQRLIQDRIIEQVQTIIVDLKGRQFYVSLCKLVDFADNSNCIAHRSLVAFGASVSAISSVGKALGEAAERYSSAVWNPHEFIRADYDSLRSKALDPESLPLFSKQQYSRRKNPDPVRFSKKHPIAWVRGEKLPDRSEIWVPACLVYFPYRFSSPQEKFWVPVTTGLACGSSWEDAVLRGICEVVERDAAAITWLNRQSMPLIDMQKAKKHRDLRSLFDMVDSCNVELYVNEITTDIQIPTFWVTLIARNKTEKRESAVSVGLKTNLDPLRALQGAVEEALFSRWMSAHLLAQPSARSKGNNLASIDNLDNRIQYYSRSESIDKLRFLIGPKRKRPLKETPQGNSEENPGAKLNTCLNKLASKGFCVVAVDLTRTPIREIGLSVVRVIIPGLQLLTAHPRWQPLGGSRVYEMAPSRVSEAELNYDLHPFPIADSRMSYCLCEKGPLLKAKA